MSYKGTVTISREEAISLILSRLYEANDNELSQTLVSLGYGDNIDLKYFGNNFYVDSEFKNENCLDDECEECYLY